MLVFICLIFCSFAAIYPEGWSRKGEEKIQSIPSLGLLRRFGVVGELLGLETRLILRHKKPRAMLGLSAFLLFYGLIFYTNPDYLNGAKGRLLFAGLMVTGAFMINYGQLLISWNSSHYDFFLSKPIHTFDFLEAKYYLMGAVSLLAYVLTVPYVFFGWEILFINSALLLFNMGVNAFVVMNMSMWSPKKMSLNKEVMMNYEGVGAAQWLMAIPVLALPFAVYLPFSLLGSSATGILALGGLGGLGLLFHRPMLAFSARRLEGKKYQISHSFRNEN